MCRLFGMSAGSHRATACFWLLEAPDSMRAQSRRDPDGTGLGFFDEAGRPCVEKAPLAAWEDRSFATAARERRSRTFVAHVRYASNGGLSVRNTHPFEQAGRLFAHNGVIGDIEQLERRLGGARALIAGDTDSERFFALITKETEAAGGDVSAGIAEAARWIAATLPVYALNLVLATRDELWALRYPDTHGLFVLEREAGGGAGRPLEHMSEARRIHVRSEHLSRLPSVVVVSEQMDDDPGWKAIGPGELLHVDPELHVTARRILDGPPSRPLTLDDLGARAASQAG